MDDKDKYLDDLLKIKTSGWDSSNADQYHYPYEPTAYAVLDRLISAGYIKKNNLLLDYGCGKGRVSIYLSFQTKCNAIGIEYDERLYCNAISNKETAISGKRVKFVCENAENYEVPVEVDRCYFFNPFSVDIFKKVKKKIMDSYYDSPRDIFLFFYYPSHEYISYLMTEDDMEFVDDISCMDMFEGDNLRERILVFKIV